ncbi:hypothetical protein [Streptomyces sp. NPDC060366]|uniref:hypothetical protein n=1 Tax=Streptomyces sp. NPDC060366 TaxID=3347105 RepID=UPI003650BFC8
MAIDHMKRREIKKAAEALLQERHGKENGLAVTGQQALDAVSLALGGYAPYGQEPREVPEDEALAALTQIEEARERLDRMELRLITAARERGASWQKVADSLGLGTRQSAETRALRLERAVQGYNIRGRDVGSQRLDNARQRAADAWCEEHADRIRNVCERLVDSSEAWGKTVSDNPTAQSYFHLMGAHLASDAAAKTLYDAMESLRYTLSPYSEKTAPVPTGKQADAATTARTDMLELVAECETVRHQVRRARSGGRP